MNHQHEFIDRDEVLKKVFPMNPWETVKYEVCKICTEIRTTVLHIKDHGVPFSSIYRPRPLPKEVPLLKTQSRRQKEFWDNLQDIGFGD